MSEHPPVPDDVNRLAALCIDSAMQVHRALGPGFKELIYQRAYCLELDARGIAFECEKPILVRYKSWDIPGQKVDLLVAGLVLVEVKAVPKLRDIHIHQVLSYLKTLNLRLGLILNFKQGTLKEGLRRVVR